MNIVNIIEDKILGCMVCLANETWQPVKWAKYLNYLLFKKRSRICFGFDLYFFNVNFDVIGWDMEEEEIEEKKKRMCLVYQEFLKHGDIVEEILWKEFLDGIDWEEELGWNEKEQETYRRKYKTKEVLFQDVTVIEVRIYFDHYAVVISLPFIEENLVIVVNNIFEKEEQYSFLIAEEESEPIEMDYRTKEYFLLTSKE